jgi:site-specific recombinase XerD
VPAVVDKTTTAALRAWLAVRGSASVPELFVSARGESLTRSGFEYILRKHVRTARQHCPSLTTKRVSPHVMRHTCALTVLQATKDLRKVSLWLGHAHTQTTEMYTRVDPSVKLEALESVVPPKLRSGALQGYRQADRIATGCHSYAEQKTFKMTYSRGLPEAHSA